MTFEQALKAEIGDTMIAGWNAVQYKDGDELILIARNRDYNELQNDTGGYFYNKNSKQCIGANIQDFTMREEKI